MAILLAPESLMERVSRRSDGSMDQEETSEISDRDALTYTETPTPTTDTSIGTSATTARTKDG
jgi:hypothetical protein